MYSRMMTYRPWLGPTKVSISPQSTIVSKHMVQLQVVSPFWLATPPVSPPMPVSEYLIFHDQNSISIIHFSLQQHKDIGKAPTEGRVLPTSVD